MRRKICLLLAAALLILFGAALAEETGASLSGTWLEKDTQFTRMDLAARADGGLDAEIISPMTHGAYVFRASLRFDAGESAFLYRDGCFWNVPITDSEETVLGEPAVTGTSGRILMEEGGAVLRWIRDGEPAEEIVFVREDASGKTVQPVMPEAFRALVAGKTFTARLMGYGWGDDPDSAVLTWQISEREAYPAEEIESLQPGDTIVAGGERIPVASVRWDEWGCVVSDAAEWSVLNLSKRDDGLYVATTDTDNPFWRPVFTIEVPADASLRYLDWSGDTEEPVELTVRELKARLAGDEIFLDENNTEITFDEDGNLSVILQRYSPWN